MAQVTKTPPHTTPLFEEMIDRATRTVPAATGRLLLSLIFLASGAMKFADWQHTADYMASKGMILIPFLLPAAAVVELLGGLSILLGFRARLGALALFLFLIPTTLIFHDFWAYEGQQMQNQMQHFMKNLAIMGGLLVIVALGAGPVSLDASMRRTRLEP